MAVQARAKMPTAGAQCLVVSGASFVNAVFVFVIVFVFVLVEAHWLVVSGASFVIAVFVLVYCFCVCESGSTLVGGVRCFFC